MALERLVNIRGKFKDTVLQFRPSGILSSPEIMEAIWRETTARGKEKARYKKVIGEQIGERPFWTANVAIYKKMGNGKLIYHLGGKEAFEVIFSEYSKDITYPSSKGVYYELNKEQLKSIDGLVKKKLVVKSYPKKLGLEKYDGMSERLILDPKSYLSNKKIKRLQRKFLEIAYGSMKVKKGNNEGISRFERSMRAIDEKAGENMLKNEENSSPYTCIWFLNRKYLWEIVQQGSAIAVPCMLRSSSFNHDFRADGHGIKSNYIYMRGVPYRR